MGPIVVGVDGSPEAVAALRWALDEARLRGTSVEAVRAWLFPMADAIHTSAADILVRDIAQASEDQLNWIVDEVAGPDPGVKIERRVFEGAPARVLVDAAAGAELLVVGSSGRGGFAGLLLGSVAQQCVHHAPCPVVVIRRSVSEAAA
jgi:nucleotide-binding universal stress UspA family protein